MEWLQPQLRSSSRGVEVVWQQGGEWLAGCQQLCAGLHVRSNFGVSLGLPLPQTALKAMYWSLVRPWSMQPALPADASNSCHSARLSRIVHFAPCNPPHASHCAPPPYLSWCTTLRRWRTAPSASTMPWRSTTCSSTRQGARSRTSRPCVDMWRLSACVDKWRFAACCL